jgi:AcrR family transcriptional regulator
MPTAHHRKKEPDLIRQRLLESAVHIAAEQPPGNLTLQSVAAAAGVTKGGLLHHFPSKESLIEAVFLYLLEQLNHDLDSLMASDPVEYGRFTRAYVHAVLHLQDVEKDNLWNALSVSMLTDPKLSSLWVEWLNQRKERHKATDSAPVLEVVRLAADGVWLQDLTHTPSLWNDREKLLTHLLGLTQKDMTL